MIGKDMQEEVVSGILIGIGLAGVVALLIIMSYGTGKEHQRGEIKLYGCEKAMSAYETK